MNSSSSSGPLLAAASLKGGAVSAEAGASEGAAAGDGAGISKENEGGRFMAYPPGGYSANTSRMPQAGFRSREGWEQEATIVTEILGFS